MENKLKTKITNLQIALVSLILLVSVGCTGASVGVKPPAGLLFTYYKAPVTFKHLDPRKPEGAIKPEDLKKGTSIAANFVVPQTNDLISVGLGDITTTKAMKDAGIVSIHYVDYSYLSILGIYNQVEMIVHGLDKEGQNLSMVLSK